MIELPIIGAVTIKEKRLTSYLLDGLNVFAKNEPIERRELIAVLSTLCMFVFTNNPSLNIKEQCIEIDAFADFLKSHALKDAVKE